MRRVTTRPASRFTSPRRSLRADEPVSAKRQRRGAAASASWTSFRSPGSFCTSSTTTQEPRGSASISRRSVPGSRIRRSSSRSRSRLYQSAPGSCARSHVVLPVPRGPRSKKERGGRGSRRVNIAGIMTVNMLASYTLCRRPITRPRAAPSASPDADGGLHAGQSSAPGVTGRSNPSWTRSPGSAAFISELR